jgi:DNA-binding transcriptional ArsR family regulator
MTDAWERVLDALVHPTKILIIEAIGWIDEPQSARQLELIFEKNIPLNLVSYHLNVLADAGAVEGVYCQRSRGAIAIFYRLPESPALLG